MTEGNGAAKPTSLNLELLIKLMKLTTSNIDAEALLALRKANEQLSKLTTQGKPADWETLLRGKVTLIADPFAFLPPSPGPTINRPSPGFTPKAPPPPPRPAPPPQYTCTSCNGIFTHGGYRPPYGSGNSSDHFCSKLCLEQKYPPLHCSVCHKSYSQGTGFRPTFGPGALALFCSKTCHDRKHPPYQMPKRGSAARKRPSLGDL